MIRNRFSLSAWIVIAALGCASSADAQTETAPKLYRWVGADGKPHYSDQIPAEALDKARQEINANGMTVGRVDRALTAEERTAAAAKAAADAQAAKLLDNARQSDQVLLASYPTERELDRAYAERISLQTEAVKATRIGMQSQQQALSSLLGSASNLELNGKPVNAALAGSIQTARRQLLEQQASLVRHVAEGVALQSEFQGAIGRYRKLRADAEDANHAVAPAAGAPPPN